MGAIMTVIPTNALANSAALAGTNRTDFDCGTRGCCHKKYNQQIKSSKTDMHGLAERAVRAVVMKSNLDTM